MACQRCGSSMLHSLDGPRCLSCGWEPGAPLTGSRSEQVYTARKVTEDDLARWRELRREGWTYEQIAAESGWSRSTICKLLNGRPLAPVRWEEVRA